MSQSPSTPDFVRALDEALLANEHGEVRFGAESEALRLSQVEALSALRGCLVEGITIGHVVQPGGTGKTREGIVAAHAMHRNDGNTLFVVPSQQAVKDFSEKARTLCPDLDVGTVYQAEKRIGRLTFITYASLLRCILGESGEEEAHAFEEQQDDPGSARSSPTVDGRNGTAIDPAAYGLVLWDEAHKYLTVNAQKLLQRFKDSINIGLTATPRYYEGKEVAHVFGRKIHELDLATAVERKEISDFRNLLITTDVMTGLALSSPDQEESAEVAQAIDIPDRNKIFPDFYRNATIDVHEKKFVLAGEPAIVFGASIQ
jgi:superfamily II DNA or RNA helicase